MAAVEIRGTTYPVLLPKLRDPRLHLAATITSLQVIGQVGFHFQVSIAQILLALATSAVLEVAIAFRSQHVLMWPASAMLTGNGVAFVLRVPGTAHGDWWSLRGWWIFVGTAAVSLLSKHVLRWRGEHVFNPSNIGLVVCFLLLGRGRAAPLDFWWGPMSWWLGLALAVIVGGGFTVLWRLRLLRVALGFWAAFAAGIGILALSGHEMTARWHLGPISGLHLWAVLITSPEVLVFLFFMITDPKTAPRSPNGRLAYALALGLLAAVMIAPTTSEFAAKVALLGSLAVVCLAIPVLRLVTVPADRRVVLGVAAAAAAACVGAIVLASPSARATPLRAVPAGAATPVTILPSRGMQTKLDLRTARLIAYDLLAATHARATGPVGIRLVAGVGQGPPLAVAELGGHTYRLAQSGNRWRLHGGSAPDLAAPEVRTTSALAGVRLENVAGSVGLRFRQGSFRFGMSPDNEAMMGGGVCWLDYNGDGWLDLFAVNSYASADAARWQAHGGLPRTALFENRHGAFRDVGRREHAALPVRGDGCVAGDLDGDGRPDLVITTTTGVELLWNDGRRGFVEGARAAGIRASGWYTGAAVADVNGDGRPDLFVAGYSEPNVPVPGSLAGFPTNLAGVRDLLYLNEGRGSDGHARFREVGIDAGLEAVRPRHGLGAAFVDANGDGRPDLYVADDEDPNQLYVNVPWPGGARADPAGLGFRFEERGAREGVADPYAGMGIAADSGADGSLGLFVTNSRGEPSAAFRRAGPGADAFADDRRSFAPALGTGFAGWGASWVDLANSGRPDLLLAAGAIPVTSLRRDAEPVRVLAPAAGGLGDAGEVLGPGGLRTNGRGLAAADAGNDGRMEVAINAIGGQLLLLRPSGPSGHWLDVRLSRFSPGAVVTADLPGGRRLVRAVQAGGSYLSSEDPRVHLGLGRATTAERLTVRYPWGGESRLAGVRADRVVDVRVPARPSPRALAAASSPALRGCTPSAPAGQSAAEYWNEAAVDVLRAGGAPAPVQARDLYDLSAATWDAWAAYEPGARGILVTGKARAANLQAARETAIAYASYRLLLWRASFDANLSRTFGLLTARLRALCLSPAFVSTSGGSPAALGNRIAAAAIASGRRDGSLERFHYADPSYTPPNQPLVVGQAGSTAHDPTFWQPLALARVVTSSGASVPARVQSFAGAQWGRVRTFARAEPAPAPPGGPALPSSAAYRLAAVAALRATAAAELPARPDPSPVAWNLVADRLPGAGSPSARLARDVRLSLALNGALEDSAVAAWRAKRAYQTPRPISMIRYLAFQGQSSDRSLPSYSPEGLPLVPGLIELVTSDSSAPGQRHAELAGHVGQVAVRSRGRWILGARWRPASSTPASPGWVSGAGAFAAAADEVLTTLSGRSFDRRAAAAAGRGVAAGVDTRADVAAGRALGTRVARAALARVRRLAAGAP